jgi:hypothetical protein
VLPTLYVSTPPCALAVASNEAAVAKAVESFMTTRSELITKSGRMYNGRGEEVDEEVQRRNRGKLHHAIYFPHRYSEHPRDGSGYHRPARNQVSAIV